MVLLGNIIWFIFFGWWNCILNGLLGALFYITIIGIPIGKSLFQFAKLMAFPFGKVIIKETDIKGKENVSAVRRVGGAIANIIWIPFGLIGFVAYVVTAIGCAITIIGIPAAIVWARAAKFIIWPIGAKVISKEEADTIKMQKMMAATYAAVPPNQMPPNQMQPNQMQGVPALPASDNSALPPQAAYAAAQPNQVQGVPVQPAADNSIVPAQNTYAAAPAQPNQTLEHLKAGGSQALGNLKDAGGKTVAAIQTTGGKTVAAIQTTSSAGMEALRNKQSIAVSNALSRAKEISLEEIFVQIESGLYRNNVMAWIMPFLEYITAGVCLLIVIINTISMLIIWR